MIYDTTFVVRECENQWNLQKKITIQYGDNYMSQQIRGNIRRTDEFCWQRELRAAVNCNNAPLTVTRVGVKQQIQQRFRDKENRND